MVAGFAGDEVQSVRRGDGGALCQPPRSTLTLTPRESEIVDHGRFHGPRIARKPFGLPRNGFRDQVAASGQLAVLYLRARGGSHPVASSAAH